jgi:hypothetical protein
VRCQDQTSATVKGVLNRRQRRPDPRIVRNSGAGIQGHVEINTQKHALPVQFKISY